MTRTDYHKVALDIAGHENDALVTAAAKALHMGESLHMHEHVSDEEPCSYCWLRAGRAVRAIREAKIPLTAPAARPAPEKGECAACGREVGFMASTPGSFRLAWHKRPGDSLGGYCEGSGLVRGQLVTR